MHKYKPFRILITIVGVLALLQKEELVMCEKVIFNVIEKNKYENIDDITKYINSIVNKLIVNEFAKSVE